MAWNESTFTNMFNNWLSSLTANDEMATADLIASLYATSSVTASPLTPAFAAIPITLNNKKIISDGFYNSFTLAKKINTGKYSDLNSGVWLPAASSIVLYWTGVLFTTSPPPPGGLVGNLNSIVFPGNPNILAEDIAKAFKAGTAKSATDKLVIAFRNHLRTITGSWVGTAPGTPPPPIIIPWAGII